MSIYFDDFRAKCLRSVFKQKVDDVNKGPEQQRFHACKLKFGLSEQPEGTKTARFNWVEANEYSLDDKTLCCSHQNNIS